MKRKIIILKKLSLAFLYSLAFILLTLLTRNKTLIYLSLTGAGLIFIPFFLYQYITLIQHCKNEYMGNNKKLLLAYLFIEPIGPIRILYTIKHLRPYMKQFGRYAYTEKIYFKQLKDLKVNYFYRDSSEKAGYRCSVISISESPVYRYLKTGDKSIFIDYHASGINKKHPDPYSLKKFTELYNTIKNKGYDYNRPAIKVKANTISDGMHRACLLYHLYGPKFKIGVILDKKLL